MSNYVDESQRRIIELEKELDQYRSRESTQTSSDGDLNNDNHNSDMGSIRARSSCRIDRDRTSSNRSDGTLDVQRLQDKLVNQESTPTSSDVIQLEKALALCKTHRDEFARLCYKYDDIRKSVLETSDREIAEVLANQESPSRVAPAFDGVEWAMRSIKEAQTSTIAVNAREQDVFQFAYLIGAKVAWTKARGQHLAVALTDEASDE